MSMIFPLKVIIASLLLAVFTDSYSQNVFTEINNQVWRKQLGAMNNNLSEQFMSTMSPDVVQVSYDRKVLRNYDEFHKQVMETYQRIRDRKLIRKMEFRFLERMVHNDIAFEDGFFRYEMINERKESMVFYGYFQVVLRKENGQWKVLVDYDSETHQGQPITEELFINAKTIDSFE